MCCWFGIHVDNFEQDDMSLDTSPATSTSSKTIVVESKRERELWLYLKYKENFELKNSLVGIFNIFKGTTWEILVF